MRRMDLQNKITKTSRLINERGPDQCRRKPMIFHPPFALQEIRRTLNVIANIGEIADLQIFKNKTDRKTAPSIPKMVDTHPDTGASNLWVISSTFQLNTSKMDTKSM